MYKHFFILSALLNIENERKCKGCHEMTVTLQGRVECNRVGQMSNFPFFGKFHPYFNG